MKVLLTRPAGENARLARRVEALGAECLEWPLTRIVALVGRVEVPGGTEAILFTSANAVRAFAAAAPGRDLPVFAVGDRTAAVAREAGFGQVTSARGDARDLVRLARATRWRRFLHPRGREAGALAVEGAEVAARVVYAAEPAGPPPARVAEAFAAGAIGLVTVWSPRNALILRDWLAAAGPPLAATALLGISEAAVEPLRHSGFGEVLVAARPNAGSMLEGLAHVVHQLRRRRSGRQ
jgi:uroporphyrinogen-III synthase